MDGAGCSGIGLEGAALIILRLAMGIDAIGVERGFEGLVLGQEIEVQVDVTCLPVGQTAHIPVAIPAFAHRDDVFAQPALKNLRMLEDRRQGAEETRIFLLPLIHRGGIAKHGERRIIDDIGGQLMATCALTHRGAVGGIPIAPGGIAHGSRRIIDEAALQTDEREGDVVARHIHLLGTPFHLLHAEHALVVDDIGEGAVQARGRVEAVIIEGEMIPGTHFGNAIGHFGCSLVVAVEEIDLEASDAHSRILSASLFKLVVEHIEDGPKHQSHITLGSILDEFLQIERRDNRQHITCSRLVPTFVEHHELDAMSRRKVDVIAIGIHVDARLEGHTCEVPIVPPVPGHLACLDPRGVADAVL